MPRPSRSTRRPARSVRIRQARSAAARPARSVGLTLGSGGAGLLSVLLAVHRPTTALDAVAFTAAALLANGIASVVESIYQYRVGIIKARGDAQVERIKAESQAKAMLMRTEARVRLLDAGLDPQLHELAIALLRQQSLDATMSDGPRLDSDDLAVLLGKPTGTGTGNPPDRGQGTYPSFLMAGRS
jgi:hypothetical protein